MDLLLSKSMFVRKRLTFLAIKCRAISMYTHIFIVILGLNIFTHLHTSWGRYLNTLKWGQGGR